MFLPRWKLKQLDELLHVFIKFKGKIVNILQFAGDPCSFITRDLVQFPVHTVFLVTLSK